MTRVELWMIFTLGLVSSLHCVQMCGPIVLSYSIALDKAKASPGRSWPLIAGHIAYNVGRVFTYSLLGAVAGLLGSTVDWMGRLAGLGSALAIVGGVLLVLAGVFMFDVFPATGALASLFQLTSRFTRPLAGLLTSPKICSRFALGLTLGLLPCGLVYAALVRALASGSAAWGAATMAAFGLGTSAALLSAGLFSSAVRGTVSRWGTKLAAASVTVMGLVLIVRGVMPAILSVGGHAAHVHH